MTVTQDDLRRLRSIADYQFGRGTGRALFPDDARIEYSRRTGRTRHIHLGDELIANFRPRDGLLTLTIAGAERITGQIRDFGYTVVIVDDVAEVVAQGRNVMAKHVVEAGGRIRPGCEVIVVDGGKKVVAVGKATLTREEMLAFEVGAAVKVRRGRDRDR